MRATALRAAVLSLSSGLGCGGGGFRAKSERSMSSSRRFNLLVTLASLLGLAGCAGSEKGCQLVVPPSCSVNCPQPPPEYLYATSINHILTFTIDQYSGALSAPQVAAGPNQSIGMVASMNGQLYVSDFLSDAVDGYSINATSGALTAIPSSPFSLGGSPPGAGGLSAFAESGTYLYATDMNAGTVAGFLYNSSNGILTPVPGSPFPQVTVRYKPCKRRPRPAAPSFFM
jgi:hypothetical protein